MSVILILIVLFLAGCGPGIDQYQVSGSVQNLTGLSVHPLILEIIRNGNVLYQTNLGVQTTSNQTAFSLSYTTSEPQAEHICRAYLDKDTDMVFDHNENINQVVLFPHNPPSTINLSLFPTLFGTVLDESDARNYDIDFYVLLYIDGVPDTNQSAVITDQDHTNYTIYFKNQFSFSPVYSVLVYRDVNSNKNWDFVQKEPRGFNDKTVNAGNTTQPLNMIISNSNSAPPAVDLLSPISNATGQTHPGLTLYWNEVTDPDTDPVSYALYLGTAPAFLSLIAEDLTNTNYTLSSLTPGTTYYWQVQAYDDYLGLSPSIKYPFSTGP